MHAVNYTTARNNLKSIIEEVYDHQEEVIITTKNDKSVVMLSLDEYNRTHAKLKQEVKEAMGEIEKDDYMNIDEAFDRVLSKYEN